MQKTAYAALAIAALSFSSPLVHATTDNPWYAGVTLGAAAPRVSQNAADQLTASLDSALAPTGNSVTSATLSGSASTMASLFGGYQVNRYLSAEVGYLNFGNLGATYDANTTAGQATANGTDKAQALSVSALGVLPLTDQWGLYARVGLARYWEKQSGTVLFAGNRETVPSTRDSGMSGLYGLGASYRVGATTWRLAYDFYPKVAKGFTSTSGGVGVLGISGQYAF